MLLPDDQSEVVVKITSKISERMAEEKIINWFNKHVSAAMYQTEIMPDIEKVNRTINLNCQELTSLPDKSKHSALAGHKAGNQCNIITPPTHDGTLKHPSEVLIELKDHIKNMTLRHWKLPDEKVLEVLGEVKVTVENRQDILPSVHKSFTRLTMELLTSLLIYQPESYTETVVESCLKLWCTSLRDTVSLNYIFSGRMLMSFLFSENQDDTWKNYTELLITMYKKGLVHPKQIQDTGIAFIPHIQDEELMSRICDCLCTFTETVPELERGDNLGSCFEIIYNRLPEGSKYAVKILHLLGLNLVTDLENDMNQLNVT